MKPNAYVLTNKGMNRDLSVSKAGQGEAYDNRNIRVTARDHDTLLSVTNERGTKEIVLDEKIEGALIGWNVLNEHIILFTHEGEKTDRIYRVDYEGKKFKNNLLYTGNLLLDTAHPIESVVYQESDDVQKIYWVDGKNVLRFMNFMAAKDVRAKWDDTSFDSNRAADFKVKVSISKENSGEARANGVAQYLLTYYNRYGQETGCVWISDLVYLSPEGRGGAADETNSNKVTLTIRNLDTSFSYFKVYMVFKSSVGAMTNAYIVADQQTSEDAVVIVDDGAHLTSVDVTSLLYLGSQPAIPGTLTHKDQTLFLGDIQSLGKEDYDELEGIIKKSMFESNGWESNCVSFIYSDNGNHDIRDIPYVKDAGLYPYENQLAYTSGEILSFKGGEKYRFAIKFQMRDGTETEAFWIGDKENTLYPIVNGNTGRIRRIVAKCVLPKEVVNHINGVKDRYGNRKYTTVRLLIAEAGAADRSVKAQGIVNPTMFNVWERYNNRLYSIPSWISRPRNSAYAWQHFEPVHNADGTDGEIQCNYWGDDYNTPVPFYQYKDYGTGNETYAEELEGQPDWTALMLVFKITFTKPANVALFTGLPISQYKFVVDAVVVEAKSTAKTTSDTDPMYTVEFKAFDFSSKAMRNDDWNRNSEGWYVKKGDNYTLKAYRFKEKKTAGSRKMARKQVWNKVIEHLTDLGVPYAYIPNESASKPWFEYVDGSNGDSVGINPKLVGQAAFKNNGYFDDGEDALNAGGSKTIDRWYMLSDVLSGADSGDYMPAYYKKHLMFVDENIVTLDSPEITYGEESFDGADYKFRIVGVAKMTSVLGDYTVDISHSSLAGEGLDQMVFTGLASNGNSLRGILSWPLWKERSLSLKTDDDTKKKEDDELDSSDYEIGAGIVHYMLHMWQRSGSITGFKSDNSSEDTYSSLSSKTFANSRVSYGTTYLASPYDFGDLDSGAIRMLQDSSESYYRLNVGGSTVYHTGSPDVVLGLPGDHKYPLSFAYTSPVDTSDDVTLSNHYFLSNVPVQIRFASGAHAVIALPTKLTFDSTDLSTKYTQTVLPAFFEREKLDFSSLRTDTETGAQIPWQSVISAESPVRSVFTPRETELLNISSSVLSEVYDSETKTLTLRFTDTNDISTLFDMALYYLSSGRMSNTVYARLVTNDMIYVVDVSDIETENGVASLYDADVACVLPVSGSSTETLYIRYVIDSNPWASAYAVLDVRSGGMGQIATHIYPYTDYEVNQASLAFEANSRQADTLTDEDQYLFIGEIYSDFGSSDTRYGGTTASAVEANRFVNAGPAYTIEDVLSDGVIYANQGDTYIQRWDDLRTKPAANSVNNVIDITSVLLETHVNLDGRTDLYRGINEIASIDTANYGSLNRVYSSDNNFSVARDIDSEFNTDAYRSTLTWTLAKADMADVDEWTHITLASTLKLDGDKGIIQALRRMQNSIVAFQDRGISEILFNSRTQMSTTDGIPVELANSGKVDGKRYITNKYGCVNKWSIVEGKNALYFVDNINKAFCAFTGQGIDNLSERLGFSAWFKRANSTDSWKPESFNNVVSFYDRIHSDVYLVNKEADGDSELAPALVYSELLNAFTGFFDYDSVPMMTDVEDRFVSFRNGGLWLQNEGLYCDFFGKKYPFWVTYRVTPSPYSDKIWTNLDYRADFYDVLDEDGDSDIPEARLLDGGENGTWLGDYLKDDTFDDIKVWNEYQRTEMNDSPVKKFRIWRYQIPRAAKTKTNPHGLDRIRNPWVNITLRKEPGDGTELMQLHDVVVKYFE